MHMGQNKFLVRRKAGQYPLRKVIKGETKRTGTAKFILPTLRRQIMQMIVVDSVGSG